MPRIPRLVRHVLPVALVLAVGSLAPVVVAPSGAGAPDAALAPAPAAADACGPTQRKADGTPWTCSFVDDFDGTVLDDDKWMVQQTADTGFRTGRTCYRDSPDNVAVRDGSLVLTVRKEGWVNCRYGPRWMRTRWTGGMVGTKGRFAQTYGRFEVRAKFPPTVTGGIHGAFWMYPDDPQYGRWPASGEIDIAEWWSYRPDLVLPSLHFDGRDPDTDSGWDCRVEDVTDFHTYTAIWAPTRIDFLIDGVPCFSRAWKPDFPLVAPQPFDQDFSMILSLGVLTQGLTWRTQFPAALVVDYAKAWR